MDSSPPPVDNPTFGTVFGCCFSSAALGSIGCSSPAAETPSELSKSNEVSQIGLLCLVAEYLAGTLRDLVALGCVNKSLKCLILSASPYEELTSPATGQFWVASGSILGKVLMKGMSQTELEQAIAEPSFEYQVPERVWLLARTSDSSETRNFLVLEFLSDTDELRQHTLDCPAKEGNRNTEGTILRSLCFYLTRCQAVRPGRLFQVWKNSSFNSQHDGLFSNQATDGLPKVNDVLYSFQFEEKLRSQTVSFLERRKSVLGRGPLWGEFRCAKGRVAFSSTPGAVASSTNPESVCHALNFLASTLQYEDHQLVNSHEWNTENYKWDLRVGCRVNCSVLGKRGWAARFTMRVYSDHCYWSAGEHLECAVFLESNSSVVHRHHCQYAHLPGRFAARVESLRADLNPADESLRADLNPADKQQGGDKPSAFTAWFARRMDQYQNFPVTAEVLALGPAGGEFCVSTDNGQLGGGGVQLNNVVLEYVARELGVPEILPMTLWRFLCNAMIPRIPEAQVKCHSKPSLH